MKVIAPLALAVLIGIGFLIYELRSAHRSIERAQSPSSEVAPSPTALPSAPPPSNTPLAPLPTPPSAPPAPPSAPGAPPLISPPAVVAPSLARGPSRFADPRFVSDPQRRFGVTVPEAVNVALHGATTYERTTAIGWLMNNSGPEQYPLLKSLTQDPDPSVRGAANVATGVMRSRYPQFMHDQ